MQETLNYWKQIPHVMKYFREEENPTARLPQDFMQSFLEVGVNFLHARNLMSDLRYRGAIDHFHSIRVYKQILQTLTPCQCTCYATLVVIESRSRVLLCVEVVSGGRKFVNNNITKVHQIVETFLERIVDRGAFCREPMFNRTVS